MDDVFIPEILDENNLMCYNENMRKHKRGFTITEVSLFLAITGLLFVGITAGMQNTIFQQRYNDSVQSFAEFLRSTYSQVSNVENGMKGGGKSDKVIYGKLIVFGQDDDDKVFSYTVVGDDGDLGHGSALEQLLILNGTVFSVIERNSNDHRLEYAGIMDEFTPKWGSAIQTTKGFEDGKYDVFKGSILILRHPKSGTVFTYFAPNDVIAVNNLLDGNDGNRNLGNNKDVPFSLKGEKFLGPDSRFRIEQIDFCINPNGEGKSNRRNVRIVKGARNASGVEVIDADSDQNKCK